MARQTRAQRRARRQQLAEEQPAAQQRPRARQAPVQAVEPVPSETTAPRREKGRFRRFLGECWGELQKVEWPTQRHVINGTVVVLVACLIVGTYLWLADIVSKHLVENLLIK